jgi:SAM-dependent methyltransferase
MGVLRGHEDAFGAALLDHHMGRSMQSVILERDDGLFEPDVDVSTYFAEFRRWGTLERSAMRFVRGRVLDVGCGAGRVALHLQSRGHPVVGIDVSTLAVKVARIRGVRTARAMSVTQADRRLGSVDTIAMMGNNLGLLASRQRARWLLHRFHGLTTDRGRIVGLTIDPFRTSDPDHLEYHRLNRRRGRMPGQVRLRIRYRTYATPWFDYLFLSPDELDRIVAGTGWHVARIRTDEPQYLAVLEKYKL